MVECLGLFSAGGLVSSEVGAMPAIRHPTPAIKQVQIRVVLGFMVGMDGNVLDEKLTTIYGLDTC